MHYVGVLQIEDALVFDRPWLAARAAFSAFLGGLVGLTISEDGGLELLDEFFRARANGSCKASTCVCRCCI